MPERGIDDGFKLLAIKGYDFSILQKDGKMPITDATWNFS